MKPLVKQVILWPHNLKVELLKPLISSLFLTQDFRVCSGSSGWSIIIWLNAVISRSANVITSFYQAAEHCRLLLTWGVELHCDGLKIVDSVTKYIAFNIWTVLLGDTAGAGPSLTAPNISLSKSAACLLLKPEQGLLRSFSIRLDEHLIWPIFHSSHFCGCSSEFMEQVQ